MGGERLAADFFARNGRKSRVPCLQLLRDIIERNFHAAVTVRLVSKRGDREPSFEHLRTKNARRTQREYDARIIRRRGCGAISALRGRIV